MSQKHSKIKLISITPVPQTNNPIVNYSQSQENPQYSYTQLYTYQDPQNQYPNQTQMYQNNQNIQPYQSFQGSFNQEQVYQDQYQQYPINNQSDIQIFQQQEEEEKVEYVTIPNCDIFSRYYDFKKVEYLQPVSEQNQLEHKFQQDFQEVQQDDEIPNELEPVEQIKKKKRRKQKNKKQKSKQADQNKLSQSSNQIEQQIQEISLIDSTDVMAEASETVQSMAQEFDDAVSDIFLKIIDQYMKEQQQNSFVSLTQSMYGKQKKQIIIQEIVGFKEIIESLCQEFPQMKFSEITMTVKLLVTYEKSKNFLQQYHPQTQQRVLRQINQLIQEEQLLKTQHDQNDLLRTQVRIEELQQAIKPQIQIVNQQISEEASLLSTAYQIIERKKYSVNSCKNDQKIIQQKKDEFSQNRNELITVYNQKAELVRQYQQNQLTQEAFERKLQGNRNRKLKLQDQGRQLFLQLMVIERDFCRVDFHKFFAAEIEDLLDGILDQIESYKIYNRSGRIRLQIIVGKGKHSIGGKPIIGPITQQYLRRELLQNVQIKEGIIDVFV